MPVSRSTFVLLPALAMCLGWGLRGFIGGGPFGAMIPGAMVALALCRLSGIEGSRAAVAAVFGAVGVGYGGEMTYGQTVGYAMDPATMWWGIGGLALKGAVWGLLGGVMIGYALTAETPTRGSTIGLAVVLIAATGIGWKLVNQPKIIYFSNPVDRPREEVWFGFLLAAIAALVYLQLRGAIAPAWRFALCGLLGGGVGFGLGGWVQHWGRNYSGVPKLDWWKAMEFTFGFLFGAAMGWAASRMPALPRSRREAMSGGGLWIEIAEGLALACALYFIDPLVRIRFAYLALGSAALCWAVSRPAAAIQLALTTTYLAFVDDLYGEGAAWGPVRVAGLLTSGVMAWTVATAVRRRDRGWVWRAFLLITWAAVAVAILKALTIA
ncbi:MAG: hypothetical protein R2762_29050, partial [Bryobacteraceae bacterium]